MEELFMADEMAQEENVGNTVNETTQTVVNKEETMNLSLNSTIDGHLRNIGLSDAQRFAAGIHILCCFSAAIGHRPYIQTKFKTYGNLNMVLLGKSGTGKGCVKNFALEIFSAFGEDVVAPLYEGVNVSCKKALFRGIHNILSTPAREDKGESRIFHINVEFGSVLRGAASSYMSELGNSLCRLIDGEKIDETFGKQRIYFPFVHYGAIYHIQPEELTRCMRAHLIYSGMVNRFLWFELPKDMNPELPRMSQEVKTALEDEIRECIYFAASKREILLAPEAMQIFDDFKNQYREENAAAHEVVSNLSSRLDSHVLKLALNLAMLRRQPEVDLAALEDAIFLADLSRQVSIKYMMEVVPHTLPIIIMDYLKEKGQRTPLEIIRDLTSPKTSEAKIRKELAELEKQGLVRLEIIDKGDGFFPKCYKACA